MRRLFRQRSRTAIAPAMVAGLVGGGMILSGAPPLARASDPHLSATVENLSKPVLCAEEDNVTLLLRSPRVQRFRIEATHPTYLGSIRQDNWDADWEACDFGPQADATAKPEAKSNGSPDNNGAKSAAAVQSSSGAAAVKSGTGKTERVTLYEDPDQWLVGWRFPSFWRPATAVVRVGEAGHKGLHLVQLWRIRPNGGEEIVVLYPQDGYWRARPKAPRGGDLTAFGSSFLVGPVEIDERPLVRLTEIVFAPKTQRFTLHFAKGGTGTVTIAALDARKVAFDVAFDRAFEGSPFAALRSMYVTEFNNDVAKVVTRSAGANGWAEAGVMAYRGGRVQELWAGRVLPSRHNTSAPDMIFKAFRAGR